MFEHLVPPKELYARLAWALSRQGTPLELTPAELYAVLNNDTIAQGDTMKEGTQ
jgi:hypothetical protein